MKSKKIITILGICLTLGALALITVQFQKPTKAVKGITTPEPTIIISSPEEEDEIPQEKFYAPIIAYHHLAKHWPQNSYYVSPEIFDQQMAWLKTNDFQVISFDKFYEAAIGKGTIPQKPVVITFDDGNVDNYTNALPILKKYGLTAIFFIKTNGISQKGKGMTWDKLKEMTEAGMTIGSHSLTHRNMARMDEETLSFELKESKKILEKNLDIEVKYFAYPGGSYSERTIEATKEAGYLAAVTTKHKVYQEIKDENSLYELPRVHIDDEMPTFMDWIQGINLY